ncbi:SgcJ/EcaC family oxidoreductase [Methylobacterium sp.]|uniref:SgcJ/EcaC family oxidoreductase n=1 Tax=Methylobacterium sp. TaxID=409 RepID=UPI0025DCABDD|nr:SgcJ/EcaC family oxidoreductase [Methylobacterium sp.]
MHRIFKRSMPLPELPGLRQVRWARLPMGSDLRIGVLATLASVLLGVGSGTAEAQAPATMACATIGEPEVAQLFERWNAALKTKDPDAVTRIYAPDAVLLPTVSNRPRSNSAEIRAYFVEFLQKDPQGRIDSRTVRIGCNTAFDVGTYTFTLKGKEPGTTEQVPARYSFVYEYRHGQWVIVHHHSSVMPETVR